jgi:hypothetical protein
MGDQEIVDVLQDSKPHISAQNRSESPHEPHEPVDTEAPKQQGDIPNPSSSEPNREPLPHRRMQSELVVPQTPSRTTASGHLPASGSCLPQTCRLSSDAYQREDKSFKSATERSLPLQPDVMNSFDTYRAPAASAADSSTQVLFSLDGPEWVVKPRCVSSCSLFLREAGIYSARLLRLCSITVFIH